MMMITFIWWSSYEDDDDNDDSHPAVYHNIINDDDQSHQRKAQECAPNLSCRFSYDDDHFYMMLKNVLQIWVAEIQLSWKTGIQAEVARMQKWKP